MTDAPFGEAPSESAPSGSAPSESGPLEPASLESAPLESAQSLLEPLDPEQRAAAEALRGPVCIVAGAGTGKTRAITHRMAYGVATGVYEPTEVLALSFTTKAAGEMRERLRRLGAPNVQARTFHSAALRQARFFWPTVYGTEFPEVVQSKFGLVRNAAGRNGLRSLDAAVVRDLAAEIEWAKVSNVDPSSYPDVARARGREVAGLDRGQVAALMVSYEDLKREANRIDMEDILLVTAAILADDERIAARVRSQYRWFVVDEFQDVNPLQSTLLDLWLGGREDVCVVGDPRQTIYSFAGASPRILADFTTRYPDAQRIELVRNYRSTPQVVAVANAVFPSREREGGTVRGRPLQAQNSPGDPVRYLGHSDEPAEAASVADDIVSLHRAGMPYREMAVLFRINAQSEAFEEALGERGVPYTLRGVAGFFDRAEVRQAVTLLRGAARSGQHASDGTLVGECGAVLAGLGHTLSPPTGAGEARNRWESLNAIVSMATDLAADDPQAGLTELVADLERRAATAHAPTAEGVTLATLHSAKGLEWDAVFCVGMHEGMLPSVHADTPEAVEEERRLFYVGVTRARRRLSISWARARTVGGRQSRGPTRFLDPLLPSDHPARGGGQTPRPKKRTAAALESLEPADRALFDKLKQWRTETASAAKVPPFVVFQDATLLALVEHKPSDDRGLSAVPGIGAAKRERYGAQVLALLAEG
ncbi:ATP-dependent helicase [Aeromicrobium sp. CTD01-1L150]|uniref:ATP-dependent helicase n=1 Tax=Aeromicrobium sp. CTD01-1L150 TaxID=3341830 RepID=UPI0035C24CDA